MKKLWLFIDEGIFFLLDENDLRDGGAVHANNETRAEAERRLALGKLDERPFDMVRLATIDQIREGIVKGSLRSFRSPTSQASQISFQPSQSHHMQGDQSFVFGHRNCRSLDFAGRNLAPS